MRGKLEDCFARLDACGAEPELVALCKQCLAFEPVDRPTDAGAVAAAVAGLRAAADERARQAELDRVHAEGETRETLARAAELGRRRRILLAASTIIALVFLVGFALVAWQWQRAERQKDIAQAAEREEAAQRALEAEARQAEALARQQAQQATTEARRRLTRLHLATGLQAEERKEPFTALQWYARAWQQDADPSNEAAHRTRLGAVLAAVPRLAGVCFHDTGVDDVDINPTGTRLVTRTAPRRGERGDAAYVWDFAAGKLAAPPLSHDGPVRFVGFSPDGSLILTASEDKTAALWNSATGKRLHVLPHAAPVVGATFAPDGKTVACAAGKQVVWWDNATGKPAGKPIECPDELWALELSADGRRLLTADQGGNARVWEVATGKPAGPPLPQKVPDADESRFYKMGPTLSPDGLCVLTATATAGQWARAFEANTGKMLWEVPSRGLSLRWTVDGRHAVVESIPAIAQVLVDRKSGNIVQRFVHPRQVPYAATSPDGQLLAAGISGGAIYLWDTTSGQLRGQPFKCADFLRRLRVSADGRWLVAASQDGTARVWDLSASLAVAPYRNDCGRAQVPVNGDGSSNSPDGRAHFRPGPDGGVLERQAVASKALGHPGPVKASRFSADGTRLATFAGNAVRVWDANSALPIGPPLVVGDDSVDVPRLELTSDGRRVAAVYPSIQVGGVEGSIRRPAAVIVWEATGRRLFTLPARIESGPQVFGEVRFDGKVSQANLSPDGRLVAAAVDSSGELSVFEVETGTRLHQTRAFRGSPYDLQFNPNGRTLFVTSSDNLARELDTATGKSAGHLLRHPSNPRSVGFSPDGRRVVTLTDDGRVRVWDLRTRDLLVNSAVGADRLYPCWFSQDGTTVQYFSGGNYWRLRLPTYAGPVEPVPLAVRLLTGRYLDEMDGLEDLGPDEFIADRIAYRRAYLAWQGLPADPAVQP